MHLHLKIPENDRKNKFRDKETTDKVPLIFFILKAFTEK